MVENLQKFEIQGYESIKKVVRAGNQSSGRLNMPKSWEGHEVIVIRLDSLEDKGDDENGI